jgi:tetratricopeptide (TPR) repeat protein
MRKRTLTLLCSLLLLLPIVASADAGSEPTPSDRVDANQVTADYNTAYRQLKAGDYKTAIKSFKRVIRADPNHAMAYTNMAYSYRQLGDYKKAVKLYEKALALAPNLPEAHEYMGEALLALGNIEAAKKHLMILEKLDPKLAEELRADIARRERS